MKKNESLKIKKPYVIANNNIQPDKSAASVEEKIIEKFMSIGIKDILVVDGQNVQIIKS